MEGIYKIRLVPNDLNTEEAILQIADTLDNLNAIVDDVFERLTCRIKQNMEKTAHLTDRIEISRNKIEKLTGMQNAIKVFSSAKYPALITHAHYQSVFDLDEYVHDPKKITLKGKPQGPSTDKGIREKLHFYHVKILDSDTSNKEDNFNLNAVIDDLETVGDLLIFKSSESPYLGTTMKTPTYVPAVSSNIDNKSLLEAAPSSILKKDVLKREVDEYMYAPGMGMVPELEMPLDLPHLPGIAGDIQFHITSDGSIAPSVVTSPVTPMDSLPKLELEELPDLKELSDGKGDMPVPLPEEPVLMPDTLDAPPSVPLQAGSSVTTVPVQATLPPPPVLTSVEAMSPPPPPPPPPPPMDILPASAKRDEKTPSNAAPPPGDAHADLMAAIRKAGGAGRAKLRPAADTEPPKASKPSSTGDLMADLHAKLSMRRRGISGAERAGTGGSVLHTLASIIPEPVEQSTPQRSSDEEDWE